MFIIRIDNECSEAPSASVERCSRGTLSVIARRVSLFQELHFIIQPILVSCHRDSCLF